MAGVKRWCWLQLGMCVGFLFWWLIGLPISAIVPMAIGIAVMSFAYEFYLIPSICPREGRRGFHERL